MSSRRYVGLKADLQQKTEHFLAEFDAEWTEQAFANSARTLPFSDKEVRRAVLVELVKIDLERRWTSGKGRRLESYLKACPELGNALMVCATETKTEADIDAYVAALGDILAEGGRRSA